MGRWIALVCLGVVLVAAASLSSPSARRGCAAMMARVWAPEPAPIPRQDDWWQAAHKEYVAEVEEADEGEGYELLFYGDSITETWRGTDRGGECERCAGVPTIFDEYFGQKFRANVLAIGGDQTAHLLYRIQNGELPKKHQPKLIVILIGTNDLAAASDEGEPGIFKAADGALHRILLTVRTVRGELPDSHVLLMGLLPRGGPNPLYPHRQPSIYTRALEVLSSRIKALTAADGHLHFLDCSEHFLSGSHADIDPRLMPDALHPSLEGYELLAECMEPTILSLVRHAAAGNAQPVGPRSVLRMGGSLE